MSEATTPGDGAPRVARWMIRWSEPPAPVEAEVPDFELPPRADGVLALLATDPGSWAKVIEGLEEALAVAAAAAIERTSDLVEAVGRPESPDTWGVWARHRLEGEEGGDVPVPLTASELTMTSIAALHEVGAVRPAVAPRSPGAGEHEVRLPEAFRSATGESMSDAELAVLGAEYVRLLSLGSSPVPVLAGWLGRSTAETSNRYVSVLRERGILSDPSGSRRPGAVLTEYAHGLLADEGAVVEGDAEEAAPSVAPIVREVSDEEVPASLRPLAVRAADHGVRLAWAPHGVLVWRAGDASRPVGPDPAASLALLGVTAEPDPVVEEPAVSADDHRWPEGVGRGSCTCAAKGIGSPRWFGGCPVHSVEPDRAALAAEGRLPEIEERAAREDSVGEPLSVVIRRVSSRIAAPVPEPVEDRPAFVSALERFRRGVPTGTRVDLAGASFEGDTAVVERALRSPTRVELDPSDPDRDHPVLRLYGRGFFVILGLREPDRPRVIGVRRYRD